MRDGALHTTGEYDARGRPRNARTWYAFRTKSVLRALSLGKRSTVSLHLRPREWRLTLHADLAGVYEMISFNITHNVGVLLNHGRWHQRGTSELR